MAKGRGGGRLIAIDSPRHPHPLTPTGFYESHVYQSDLIKFYHNRGISVQVRKQTDTYVPTSHCTHRHIYDPIFLHHFTALELPWVRSKRRHAVAPPLPVGSNVHAPPCQQHREFISELSTRSAPNDQDCVAVLRHVIQRRQGARLGLHGESIGGLAVCDQTLIV